MKKTKSRPTQLHQKQPKLTPTQAWKFLEDYNSLIHGIDTKTKLISIRIPENVLSAFKTKTKLIDKKYQSQIVQLMRDWIQKK